MADAFVFIQNGWKNIWKQKTIWLFSALSILNQWIFSFQIKPESKLLGGLLSLGVFLISIILFYISLIGVPYLAYTFSIGKVVTVQETLLAVRKLLGRVIGCSCLGFILIIPLALVALAISRNDSAQTVHMFDKVILLLLPISLFSALWDFSLFGFFANDWGIRQSLKNAWALFTSHFSVLAILGISVAIIIRIYSTASGILAVLFQSGFDITSLAALNYINPAASLSKNILFAILNGIGGVIFTPFFTSVFVLAYLKYSGAKKPSAVRQK
jgi:hypothetical protein